MLQFVFEDTFTDLLLFGYLEGNPSMKKKIIFIGHFSGLIVFIN